MQRNVTQRQARNRRASYIAPYATTGEQLRFVLGLSIIAVIIAAIILVGLS